MQHYLRIIQAITTPKTENQAYTQIRVEKFTREIPMPENIMCSINMKTGTAYLYKLSSKSFKPLIVIRLTGSMEGYQPGTSVGGAFWLSCPNLLGFYPPIQFQCY